MKKELLFILLIVVVMVISGCETEVSEEEIVAATEDFNNITNQELQVEIESRSESVVGKAIRRIGSSQTEKLIPNERSKEVQKVADKYSTSVIQKVLESRKNFVYEIKLNPQNWDITGMRVYEQDEDAKVLLEKYVKQRDGALGVRHKMQLEVEGQIHTDSFDVNTIRITEEFSENGNITLINYEDGIPLKEIIVRVPTGISLTGKSFIVRVLDEQGNEVTANKYTIKEESIESKPLAGSAYYAIDPDTLEEARNTILLLSKEHADPVIQVYRVHDEIYLYDYCNNLEEVIPEHNRLGENRINIIFQAGSEGVVISNLLNLIDLDGEGITIEYPISVSSMGTITIHGLFGEMPFPGNTDLFNFWYSVVEGPRVPGGRGDPYNTCSTYLPGEDFIWEIQPGCKLSNKINIHLINTECRDVAEFDGTMALSYGLNPGIFVHEMGHALGQLADEYVEEEFGNQWMYPNCANNLETAGSWGWYPLGDRGCAYLNSNYRPTQTSIMRSSINRDFDYVNENHLCFRMAELTGKICEGGVIKDPLDQLPPCPMITAFTTIFFDNFEANIDNWELTSGWDIPEIEGNWVLRGEGHHFVNLKQEYNWDNYVFDMKIKPEAGTMHINFRSNDNGRYFVSFSQNHIDLRKQYNGWGESSIFEELVSFDAFFNESWHRLRITVNDNLIIICIDGKKVFQVEDNTHSSGDISFETLDNSTFYVDDILVRGIS